MPGAVRNPRLKQIAQDAMRGAIYRELSATNGNVKAAAINLGYSPHSFYQVLQRFGIKLERVTFVRKPET